MVSPVYQPRRSRSGLSLPEMMISLAITSLLLVAVAAAFCASTAAIETNDDFFRSSQAARVTLNQILAEIRNCDSLDMSTANTISIIRPDYVAGSGQNLYRQTSPKTEVNRSFVYDPAGKQVTLQIFYTDGTASPLYPLASNVSACQFGPADMGLDYNNATIPVRVPVTITVKTGNNAVVLNGSAAPRRATKY